ncbi:hypothetical protein BO70DRAFT_45539 [Aspergillus heteromorphus CBS 117.55]|uniref:Uncharacterized protein n=1 Tax=Aspergillus heteromorphus CBS 117.55 TaxID=1448321 RepID=A0A317W3Q4_9EURO|nr:uncharacterized protein BO70DRAFT_45539 [Aspergillus heteromorphus CBS 117.55]PWY80549.1 hypothetical protein BO70DRAFT_45539 [Aspergillus heteromorphus CBS 117.55]
MRPGLPQLHTPPNLSTSTNPNNTNPRLLVCTVAIQALYLHPQTNRLLNQAPTRPPFHPPPIYSVPRAPPFSPDPETPLQDPVNQPRNHRATFQNTPLPTNPRQEERNANRDTTHSSNVPQCHPAPSALYQGQCLPLGVTNGLDRVLARTVRTKGVVAFVGHIQRERDRVNSTLGRSSRRALWWVLVRAWICVVDTTDWGGGQAQSERSGDDGGEITYLLFDLHSVGRRGNLRSNGGQWRWSITK